MEMTKPGFLMSTKNCLIPTPYLKGGNELVSLVSFFPSVIIFCPHNIFFPTNVTIGSTVHIIKIYQWLLRNNLILSNGNNRSNLAFNTEAVLSPT